jgi:hypothetical protein
MSDDNVREDNVREDVTVQQQINDHPFIESKHHINQINVRSDERGILIADVYVTCFCDAGDTGHDNHHVISVPASSVVLWMEGDLIQRVMPNLDDDTRELFVTGYCPTCWDALFSPSEKGLL